MENCDIVSKASFIMTCFVGHLIYRSWEATSEGNPAVYRACLVSECWFRGTWGIIREIRNQKVFSTSSIAQIGQTYIGKNYAVSTENIVCGPVSVIGLLLNAVKYKVNAFIKWIQLTKFVRSVGSIVCVLSFTNLVMSVYVFLTVSVFAFLLEGKGKQTTAHRF